MGGGILHKEFYTPIKDKNKYLCRTTKDIEYAISEQLRDVDLANSAILLSGGIDSGILASYMPEGTVAYTANSPTPLAELEVKRAKAVCDKFGLIHRVVDITWEDYQSCIDNLMIHDGCPVFANEPQVYTLAKKIKEDGFSNIIFGDSADMVFGGYDKLLSKDWTFDEWVKRFTFLEPKTVLKEPASVHDVYERYRKDKHNIDYLRFINEIFAASSSGAYVNAFHLLGMDYIDPYAHMKMGSALDLSRVRAGESKYMLRELYKQRFPETAVPEKIAMARAVDKWLSNWLGTTRDEFIPNIDIIKLSGEQKFLLYSLERFLNIMNL